jgi:hypothetical protein
MLWMVELLLHWLVSLVKSRRRLEAEYRVLHHQVNILRRSASQLWGAKTPSASRRTALPEAELDPAALTVQYLAENSRLCSLAELRLTHLTMVETGRLSLIVFFVRCAESRLLSPQRECQARPIKGTPRMEFLRPTGASSHVAD